MADRFMWLACSACQHKTLCDELQLAARLRTVGMLRREADPSPDMIDALVLDASRKMECDKCGHVGLAVTIADDLDEDEWGSGGWGEARQCQRCSKIIPAERLEVFPDSKFCAACQGLSEAGGADDDEPEYCPRCGSLLVMRRTTGTGISRYQMVCTGCGARVA